MTITHQNDLQELEKEMKRNADLRYALNTAASTIDDLVAYNNEANATIRRLTDTALRQSAQWEQERAALVAEVEKLRGALQEIKTCNSIYEVNQVVNEALNAG